jgi:hypothetical protein
MHHSKKAASWFRWALCSIASVCPVITHADILISANHAGIQSPIVTYLGQCTGPASQVNSFVPDGGVSGNGRAIAISGSRIFYTDLADDNTSDAIHVAPYGTAGSGGHDIKTLPNPRPGTGIQDLAYFGGALYALTGYWQHPPAVYKLNPSTGAVLEGPIYITGPIDGSCDGFAVLPNGNFLINGTDGSSLYHEYSHTTGALVVGGLVIDLFSPNLGSYQFGTGVTLAPDGQSLYFVANHLFGDFGNTIVQTDLLGNPLSSRVLNPATGAVESIAVVGTDPGPTIIRTVAGNHASGGTYSGDGGPALSAGLSGPLGIAFDTSGDLFIADTYNSAVREVVGCGSPGSYITSPLPGYFSSPCGVVLDANGYLDVADADSGGILEFQNWPSGPIYRNSNPELSVAKDGAGNLYCIDETQNSVSKIAPDGSVTTVVDASVGLRVHTYLPVAHGIIICSAALDSQGNLYIADIGNNVVRKVNANGAISTVAGNFNAGYYGDGDLAVNARLFHPAAVAVDAQGNLYIADSGNNVIRRVDLNGVITTVAGYGQPGYSGDGGPALGAKLNAPAGLAFDASGNLYISDTGNDVIRKLTFCH